jgi:hypothetical protein
MRPDRSEYADFYHTYVGVVPDGDIVQTLRAQLTETERLLRDASEGRADFRYAPGKWTLKEVVGHLVDAEWVFTVRALHFARGDTQPLPGMDQEEFAARASFAQPLPVLVEQLRSLRAASVLFFEALTDAEWNRTGNASGCDFTVRSIAWIIAGHELHHRKVLAERYLATV